VAVEMTMAGDSVSGSGEAQAGEGGSGESCDRVAAVERSEARTGVAAAVERGEAHADVAASVAATEGGGGSGGGEAFPGPLSSPTSTAASEA
jgi:hypothetical protein